jgi:anti-sigma regulatory factor (Ser/Thr protein kinase)
VAHGDGRSIRIDVPCDLAAMAAARSHVVGAASGWGFVALDELEIVLSELLTNAIRHGHSSATVSCAMDPTGAIDLAVADTSRDQPVPRPVDDVATHGRGLAIVEALCDRWGTTPVPGDGKTVWAHLSDGTAPP